MRYFIILLILSIPNISYATNARIRIAGSSTVFPFVSASAERFGDIGIYKTPIVESTGTGGGMKLFCAKDNNNSPDIANASRPMKQSEIKLCAKNNIGKITELKIGYDGIIIANNKSEKILKISIKELFLALAIKVPQNGKLVDNFYQNWNEISPNLPNKKIILYGPASTSGTRDAFAEIVMEKGCEYFDEFKTVYPNKKKRKKFCHILREDGAFIEAGENDNLIVQKLINNKNAYGIFGYSFLEQNSHIIQGAIINNKKPTFDNISNGEYGISRSLFIYIKNSKTNKMLKSFLRELTSFDAMGKDGYLIADGLIPLSLKELLEIRKKIRNIKQ